MAKVEIVAAGGWHSRDGSFQFEILSDRSVVIEVSDRKEKSVTVKIPVEKFALVMTQIVEGFDML